MAIDQAHRLIPVGALVIIGNRDFLPDQLVSEARRDLLDVFSRLQIDAVMLGEQETKLGAVETWQHAKACAELFIRERARIDGVLVCLPNFGDEKGVADVLLDLSEVLDGARRLDDRDDRVRQKLADIRGYAPAPGVPNAALTLMAKLGVVVSDWMTELDLDATAIQCWSSLQNYGVNCCTIMSMMSEKLMPSACEVDVAGTAAMYALQLASGKPSALVDWNNNYGDDPNKCVFFHCGNWAKAFLPDATIATAPILGSTLGEQNTYGAMAGRTSQGPVTFGRVSTDDQHGGIRAYVGEGRLTDDPLDTFGTRAVVEVPDLQKLTHFICRNGFEHHAAMNASHSAGILTEAMRTYLKWDVHRHS
jgi:L-fucose isomerase-like protein